MGVWVEGQSEAILSLFLPPQTLRPPRCQQLCTEVRE